MRPGKMGQSWRNGDGRLFPEQRGLRHNISAAGVGVAVACWRSGSASFQTFQTSFSDPGVEIRSGSTQWRNRGTNCVKRVLLMGPCAVCQADAVQCCSKCKSAYYCSRQHQKDDWKRHKGQCLPYKASPLRSLPRSEPIFFSHTITEVVELKSMPFQPRQSYGYRTGLWSVFFLL